MAATSSSLAESSTMAAHRTAQAALASLDDILASSASPSLRTIAPPSPTKKRMMERAQETSVSTPALMDLLPARKKLRKTVAETVNAAPQSREKMHYNPHSAKDLLDRLATYKLSLWNDSRPSACTAVDFARQGWRCTGKRREEVVCQACEATWALESVKDWRSEQGRHVAEVMRGGISSRHVGGCPWRDRPCPPSLYRVPTSLPPALLLKQTLESATKLPQSGYSIVHPLSDQQVQALHSLLKSERCQALIIDIKSGQYESQISSEVSTDSCILALFGWQQSQNPTTDISFGTILVHCSQCARRLMLKSSSSSAAGSSVNVRSAHRRWCAYLQTDSDSAEAEESWLAILNAITRQRPVLPKETIQAQPGDTVHSVMEEARLDKAQTKNAVAYVKQLLAGGHDSSRHRRSSLSAKRSIS